MLEKEFPFRAYNPPRKKEPPDRFNIHPEAPWGFERNPREYPFFDNEMIK